MEKKLVCGMGINDANYTTSPKINGKQQRCPYYKTWKDMIERCYDPKVHKKFPTYAECTVHPDWLYFSNFRRWMEGQDWEGKHLDKDLKIPGNKMYSPATCMFVTPRINGLILKNEGRRGNCLIGVTWHKCTGKFRAQCKDYLGNNKHLGLYSDELSAHLAYIDYKVAIINRVALEQSNTILRDILLNYSDSIKNSVKLLV